MGLFCLFQFVFLSHFLLGVINPSWWRAVLLLLFYFCILPAPDLQYDDIHFLSSLFESVHSQKPLLTVGFTSGDISLMNNYDDLSPTLIRTGLKGAWPISFSQNLLRTSSPWQRVCFSVDVVVQWCSQGDLLAVAGMERSLLPPDPSSPPPIRNATVKFYNVRGEHIYSLDTPAQVNALRILIIQGVMMLKLVILDPLTLSAAAPHHHSVLGSQGLAPVPGLWACAVHFASGAPRCQPAAALPAGNRNCSEGGKRRGQAYDAVTARVLRHRCVHPHDQGKRVQTLDGVGGVWFVCSAVLLTNSLFCFQPPVPDPNNMRDFVSYPNAGNERLHCTMKRTEDNPEVGSPCYTLYLEYMGGLVPILKGRRISKLRPEFVIMDPKTDGKTGKNKKLCYRSKFCFKRANCKRLIK